MEESSDIKLVEQLDVVVMICLLEGSRWTRHCHTDSETEEKNQSLTRYIDITIRRLVRVCSY